MRRTGMRKAGTSTVIKGVVQPGHGQGQSRKAIKRRNAKGKKK